MPEGGGATARGKQLVVIAPLSQVGSDEGRGGAGGEQRPVAEPRVDVSCSSTTSPGLPCGGGQQHSSDSSSTSLASKGKQMLQEKPKVIQEARQSSPGAKPWPSMVKSSAAVTRGERSGASCPARAAELVSILLARTQLGQSTWQQLCEG